MKWFRCKRFLTITRQKLTPRMCRTAAAAHGMFSTEAVSFEIYCISTARQQHDGAPSFRLLHVDWRNVAPLFWPLSASCCSSSPICGRKLEPMISAHTCFGGLTAREGQKAESYVQLDRVLAVLESLESTVIFTARSDDARDKAH
jgi:hypothetical protein